MMPSAAALTRSNSVPPAATRLRPSGRSGAAAGPRGRHNKSSGSNGGIAMRVDETLDRARDSGRPTRRQVAGTIAGGALLAAACGQAAAPAAGGPAQNAGGSAGARKALSPARIAFFSNWGAQHQASGQQKVLDAFQAENPGVTVEMTTGAAKADKIISSIAAGAAPDVVSQNPGLLIPLAMKNTWRPLEDYVKSSPVVKRENYADAQLKLSSWKGKLYGVPAFEHFGGYALSMNALHFQEAGLDASKPPATPDDLLKAHERLTKLDG